MSISGCTGPAVFAKEPPYPCRSRSPELPEPSITVCTRGVAEMPSDEAAWDIYAAQMSRTKLGVALWYPSPTNSYVKIKRGHVGFVVRGRFELLFDSNGPLGGRILGRDVPIDFEPLPEVASHGRSLTLPPRNLVVEGRREFGIGVHATSELLPVGGAFEYHSTSSKGAVLLTNDCVVSEDATRERAYMRYIKKHFKSWLQFAEAQDYNVGLGDLILVTGHDTTRDYAMAAFANNNSTLRIAFQAGFPGAPSTSVSVWGTWHTSPFVYHNCGPMASPIVPSSSAMATIQSNDAEMSTEDSSQMTSPQSMSSDGPAHADFSQCIFLRGYRMRERRPLSPAVVNAAAIGANRPDFERDTEGCTSPLLAGEQENAEDSDNVSFYSDTTPFVDPLEPLFEYLFANSQARFALVHDKDLQVVLRSATTTEPSPELETLLGYLRPEIAVDRDGIAQLVGEAEDETNPPPVSAIQIQLETGVDTREDQDEVDNTGSPVHDEDFMQFSFVGSAGPSDLSSPYTYTPYDLSSYYLTGGLHVAGLPHFEPSPPLASWPPIPLEPSPFMPINAEAGVRSRAGSGASSRRASDASDTSSILRTHHRSNSTSSISSERSGKLRTSRFAHSDSENDEDMVVGASTSRAEAARRQRLEAEQRRREEIREAYVALKDALHMSGRPASKLSIMERATTRIQELQEQEVVYWARVREAEEEVKRLRLANEALSMRSSDPKGASG